MTPNVFTPADTPPIRLKAINNNLSLHDLHEVENFFKINGIQQTPQLKSAHDYHSYPNRLAYEKSFKSHEFTQT